MENLGINITASVRGVREAFREVSNSMRELNARMGTTTASTSTLRTGMSGLRTTVSGVSGSVNGLSTAMRALKVVMNLSMWIMLARYIGKAVNSATEMTETTNLFSNALGDMAVETDKVVQKLAEMYGLDPTNLQNSVGTFAMLASSMGMTSKDASVLSTNITRLALDLSSLNNVPVDKVIENLRSGLLGQSEAVTKYGIDVSEAGLKAEAMAEGISKSVREMSRAEKMALAYNAMLRQTSIAQGDMAETIKSPANQLRILSEQFSMLSRAIGSIFLPLLQVLLPHLIAFVSVLIDISNAIAKFFGFEPPKVTDTATKGMNAISLGADNATKAVGGTSKAIQKLRQSLMGFDELNILPTATPADTGVTGAGATGVGAIGGLGDIKLLNMEDLLGDVESVSKELKEGIVKRLKSVRNWLIITAPLFASLKIAELLIHFDKLLVKLGMTRTELSAIQYALKGLGVVMVVGGLVLAIKGFKDILEESKPTLKSFAEALGGIALVAGGVFLLFGGVPALITLAVGAIAMIGVYVYKYWDEIKAYTLDKWNKVKAYFIKLWDDVKKGFSDMLDSIKDWFKEKWESIKEFVTTTIPNIIGDIVKWFDELPNKIAYALGFALGTIVKWVVGVWDYVKVEIPKLIENIRLWFEGLPAKIKTAVDKVKDKIVEWGANVKNWFNIELPKIISNVVEWFKGIPNKVLVAMNNVKTKIIEWKNNVIVWFNTEIPKIVTSVVDWFKGIPQKIKDGLSGIYWKIKDIGKYLLDGIFEGLANWKNKVKGWGDSFIQGFKDALGIHSPSRLMRDEVGKNLGLGIMVGLNGTKKGIIGTANGIADGIQGAFTDVSIATTMDKLTPSKMFSENSDLAFTSKFQGAINGSVNSNVDVNGGMKEMMVEALVEAMDISSKQRVEDENQGDLVLQVNGTEFGRVAINTINKITKQEGRLALNI